MDNYKSKPELVNMYNDSVKEIGRLKFHLDKVVGEAELLAKTIESIKSMNIFQLICFRNKLKKGTI